MSFFKRLKEKLIGNTEEEKVQQELENSEVEVKSDDSSLLIEEGEQIKSVEEIVDEVIEEIEEAENKAQSDTNRENELEPVAEVVEKKPSAWSITQKFKQGLSKTRDTFTSKVNDLVARYRKVDEDFFEELEEVLLQADVGFDTVMELMDKLRFEVQRKNIKDTEGIQAIISEKLVEIYEAGEEDIAELNLQPDGELTVILFVGVNGVGKTTTIGKLAHRLKSQGKSVILAAGDTFRAGAIDQLQVWGDRVGCEVIKQSEGSDPAAVIYDAIGAARKRGADVLICDTAGRLQNKVNLMKELEKVHRVISREIPNAPHEVLLALDATTGQNALVQAQTFKEATNVTGIVLTKLDGTAKGGIVLAIRNKLHIPVKFVGLGEKMDDLQPFDAERYVYGLFAEGLEKELEKIDD
ncbi:signal recognition particle-docking protein FtsY [Ureibacillus sp. 179-F W5.1 NHS]|uniref:Signal recognition particle receptor FtsY n=1 Tax=Lysinibacillus halotolerans TaxID=1368476 RepID=A0A3M8HGY9_9BACI|nr:signal recognition particle-docking protein FtsY [Lysinibacillus halotolerans]RND01680.1 signal recognition particle-docking protein FtsY [Lysinibacillus halotolerans]